MHVILKHTLECICSLCKTSTREELYENVRDWLETKNSYEIKRQIYEELLSTAVDNATIKECPEELLGYYKDLYVGQYESFANMYGMDLDELLKANGLTMEELENKYQVDAEKTLVAGAIAEEEGIVIDDTVYDEELRKIANLQSTSVEEFEQSHGKYYFLRNLVGEFLLNNAIAE